MLEWVLFRCSRWLISFFLQNVVTILWDEFFWSVSFKMLRKGTLDLWWILDQTDMHAPTDTHTKTKVSETQVVIQHVCGERRRGRNLHFSYIEKIHLHKIWFYSLKWQIFLSNNFRVFVVVQSLSHIRLCDFMDCSTLGFHALPHHPELAQTHVHWVDDAIQPPHPLSSLSPPAFSISQHKGFF